METEHREVPAPAAPPKVIKRYANRKLYDTGASRYVTLEEVGTMIKQGLEIQIVDNRSKEDLTGVTLAQIILEEEKKLSCMPREVLRDIIRKFAGSEAGATVPEVPEAVELAASEAHH
jgi:polyhydroxyalkanoate synthesis repressor PhaR